MAALRYMVLPATSLGLNQSALIARISRSCMLDVLQQDYIRTARAKGLSERIVVYIHAFRNALYPEFHRWREIGSRLEFLPLDSVDDQLTRQLVQRAAQFHCLYKTEGVS